MVREPLFDSFLIKPTDIEEGELADSQPVAEEVGAQPTSSSMAAASSQESTRTEKRPTVIERIVWDQPSTSTSQFEGGIETRTFHYYTF